MSKRILFLLLTVVTCSLFVVGCGGSSNSDSATVTTLQAQVADLQAQLDANEISIAEYETQVAALEATQASLEAEQLLSKTATETCSTCHDGTIKEDGDAHQALYDAYNSDAYTVTVTGITYVANADPTKSDITLTFTVANDGVPYTGALSDVFTANTYSFNVVGGSGYGQALTVTDTPTAGVYTASKTASTIAPGNANYFGYVELAATPISYHQGAIVDKAQDADSHFQAYEVLAAGGKAYGTALTTASNANVAGCAKCHGDPYLKHGHIDPLAVDDVDFLSCKLCHNTSAGSDVAWQILKDDPARAAEIAGGSAITGAETTKYAYTRNLMNDVHMSHNMEFAYPQSMSNCVTCHEGKLTTTLADANFVRATCQSCHALDSLQEVVDANSTFNHADVSTMTCEGCHFTGNGYGAPLFTDIHTGYDSKIYSSNGTKFTDAFTTTIDSASYDATSMAMTIGFTVAEAVSVPEFDISDVSPTVYVALYGYDTKDFLARVTATATETATAGTWTATADLTDYAADIAAGVIYKRAEIAVLPKYADVVGEPDSHSNGETDDYIIGVDAPSKTFNFADGDFQASAAAIVDVTKCNACHSQLATTFHSGDRGGNIVVCRMCHVPTSGGSHLEMQSRSIDSYVHAIHSFQAFDSGDVDMSDPVAALEYEHHTELHYYPNFTITNCESCHNAGTYNVPDQDASLPGKFSGSDTWATTRNIGAVPSYDAGPASRACGSCHRAVMIKEDNATALTAFNTHTETFGYLIEDATGVLDTIIKTIMEN